MRISEAQEGMFSVKIEIGQYFGVKPNEAWIKMRETNEKESFAFTQNSEENVKLLRKIWPDCIIDHNFVDDDDDPASLEKVINLLKKSGDCITYICERWMQENPMVKRNAGKLGKLQYSTSTEKE